MPIYEKAPAECREICGRMMERYHGPLRDAKVTVDLLFASAPKDEDGEPLADAALKLHGYQVAGICKINAYKLRVQDHADAEIIIDGDRWDEWSTEEKESLIDHELEHLELKTDKDGNLIRDDLDRPKLRMRLHDHEHGWFDAIARRHGKASFEVQQYEAFKEKHRQLWIDFKDDDETTVTFTAGGKSATTTLGKMKSLKEDMKDEFRKRGILAESKGSSRKAAAKR